jgi:flagellar hook-associated protein 2
MSTSSTSSTGSYSSTSRMFGLSGSGLDVDSIVESLMTTESAPLNKVKQKKQLAEWKQDAYRDVISDLKTFKDTYFNTSKSSSNMMSSSSFKQMTGTSTDSDYVTISGNADATTGSHTVSVISIATAGKAASSSGVTDDLIGDAISDYDLDGKTFKMTLDGVTKEITLGDYSSDTSTFETKIQALVDNAFGSGKVTVGFSDSKLTFDTAGGAGKITLASGSTSDGLASLGFDNGASNRLDTSSTLSKIASSFAKDLTFNDSGNLVFTINSKQFTFSSSTTLSKMMSTINSDSTANVTMKYDETSDKFVITSDDTGSGENIVIGTTQGGNFFGSESVSGINTGNATTTAGTDASAKIDDVLVTRSTNTITLDGTSYTLIKAHSDPSTDSETVTLSVDTDAVYENITAFVDAYNDLIDTMNTKISEEYDRDYQPLTDAQKEEMSDDEIADWEEQAKTGLLQNDSLLQGILSDMRTALYDSVSGLSTGLADIGITTGDYSDKGKLEIDEDALKEAIESDPDAVADLFTQEADTSYTTATTSTLRNGRYKTEGLANRLSDVLNDAIRTTNGKGTLLLKAGMVGDTTQYTSTLYDQIDQYDEDIDELEDKLSDKEDYYYSKYTALETYIYQMSNQSSYITSLLSSS